MSVLNRISTLFGITRPARAHHAGSANGARAHSIAESKPLDADAPGAPGVIALADEPAPARSKQEMIADLQRSYTEVVDLVRKMSMHLDRESERAGRVAAIIERLPSVLDAIPELRAQNQDILYALRESLENSREGDERLQNALAHITTRLEESRESDAQLVTTLADFRTSIREMASSSSRASDAILDMNERNATRDRDLGALLTSARRWMLASTIIGAAGMLTAIVVLALAASGALS